MQITIKGVEQFSADEREQINELLADSYEKLKRKAKTDFILKVAIKSYSKSTDKKDKRNKYSIQASISGAVRPFEASADDWDLRKTIREVMQKLENEIEHAFHSSEQHN